MRSSIKDLSHLKLGNILSNLIYPRGNDFLLTYPSLVKINVKNNKLRISSTGSTLWKQLVRVVIKLIKKVLILFFNFLNFLVISSIFTWEIANFVVYDDYH